MERVREVLSVLDVMYQYSPGYMRQVVDVALRFRDQVSQGPRDSLNAAINNSGIRLDGFRDTSKADADTLVKPVFDQLADGNERLLRSILRTWMESREVLRAQVAESLDRLGIPTDGLRGKNADSIEVWEEEEWLEKLRIVTSEAKGEDEKDVKLMMTCVTGMAPDLPDEEELESALLKGWLQKLRELPAVAHEWIELDLFVRELGTLAHEKAGQMIGEQTERLEVAVEDIRGKFEDELGYLEVDISGWVEEAKAYPFVFPEAVTVAESLHDCLLQYMNVRPIARTRKEELERREKRDSYEDSIYGFMSEWKELVDQAVRVEEKRREETKEGKTQAGEGVAHEEVSVEVVVDLDGTTDAQEEEGVGVDDAPQAAAAAAELEAARRENDRLRGDRETLESERRGLEVKLSDMEEEVDRLRRELYESQQTEKVWREQFVSVSKSVGDVKGEVVDEIRDVEDAVERAGRAFPAQLVVSLNSKSDVATPFQRPEEVYDVLAWLGTEYHRARTRETGRGAQFDKLLKEACSGWFYKPKQTDETKDQYPDWYRTRVGEREYELDAHVGKGTSFDPQNTIRIAFDWDDEGKRVVVGYIGRHQKNRRS